MLVILMITWQNEIARFSYKFFHNDGICVIYLFAAGLEEISARLNLMVKAELSELTAAGPKTPGDPRCQYLENLLGKIRGSNTFFFAFGSLQRIQFLTKHFHIFFKTETLRIILYRKKRDSVLSRKLREISVWKWKFAIAISFFFRSNNPCISEKISSDEGKIDDRSFYLVFVINWQRRAKYRIERQEKRKGDKARSDYRFG